MNKEACRKKLIINFTRLRKSGLWPDVARGHQVKNAAQDKLQRQG